MCWWNYYNQFKVVFKKRRLMHDFNSLPYGYMEIRLLNYKIVLGFKLKKTCFG
jgi:hypothetical protein